MESEQLAAGACIAGRYEIQRHLGGGGSAQTYAAFDKTTQSLVAIKVFTLRGGAWKSFELFEREAAVLGRLEHPAIPKLIESFTAETERGPTFYLVESFVEGRTLADEAREQRLDEQGARKVAVDLLGILAHLQSLNPPVVHRDIKPANILRRPNGALALVDFGSVRAKDPNADSAATTIVGTYGFMAPEQYRGIAVPATDLHGVGATLVYLLTGKTPDALPQQKLRPVLPTDLRLSSELRAWLSRLLEPAPEDRFQSAVEALDALASGRSAPRPSRRRTYALAGLLAVVAGASAVAYRELGTLGQSNATAQVAAAPLPPQGKLLPMPDVRRSIDLKRVTTISAHATAVSCLKASPDGKLLLTGSGDRSVRIWSTAGWTPQHTLTGHSGIVWGCGFSADSKLVVTTGDRTIRTFDAATGTAGPSATAPNDLHYLRVDGERVLVSSAGSEALAWQLPGLATLPSFPATSKVISVAISRDGSTTAVGGADGSVRLQIGTGAPLQIAAHVGGVGNLLFSPDGKFLASAGDDGVVRLWSIPEGKLWRTLSGSPGTEAWNLAWTPEGETLLVGDKAGALTSFRLPIGQIRFRWERGNGAVSSLALSEDGKLVFIGSMQGTVQVFAMPQPATEDSIPRPKADLENPPILPGLAREAERLLDEDGSMRRTTFEQAGALLDKALAQNPRDALALVQQARIARFKGYKSGDEFDAASLTEARKLVAQALALQPKLPEAFALLVALETAEGKLKPESDKERFARARAAFLKLLELEPEQSRTFMLGADLSIAEGVPDEARKTALRALELARSKREAALAYGVLASVHIALKELAVADICHRRILELRPDSAWAQGNYAQFLRRRGLLSEAKTALDTAKQLGDYPMLHHYLRGLYIDMGIDTLWSQRQPAAAREVFELALKEAPNDPDALYGLAAVDFYEATLAGRACDTCRASLDAVLKLKPSNETFKAARASLPGEK